MLVQDFGTVGRIDRILEDDMHYIINDQYDAVAHYIPEIYLIPIHISDCLRELLYD